MIEKLWCVYKHTNKQNGKVYIGRCRWPRYKDRWANGNGYKKAPIFWPAIERYGWDMFTHEILYSGLDVSEANRLEKEEIQRWKANDPEYGYNVCGGGAGFTAHHTSATRRSISETLKKYEMTENHRKHISESKAGTKHHFAKSVYQFTMSGALIREWEYMTEASRQLGIKKTNISACCRGKRMSAGGYKWTYEWR